MKEEFSDKIFRYTFSLQFFFLSVIFKSICVLEVSNES